MDLLETSKLMREQDNRSTQYPLFVVHEKIERTVADGRGDKSVYIHYDGGDYSEISVEQYDILEEEYSNFNGYNSEEFESTEEAAKVMEELRIESIEDFNPDEWEKIEISVEWEMSDRAGFFFTEKACHEHIEQNNYHYTQPRSYVISAWRNPEIVATMHMILKLTGEEIPSHYA